MQNRLTLKVLKEIESNESELYKKLYETAYNNLPYEEGIYEHYLTDKREDIQNICLKSLLFYFGKKNPEYIQFACEKAANEKVDFDLRNTALTGIGKVYFDHRNPEIEELLLNLYRRDDSVLRGGAFMALMSLLGKSPVEVIRQNERMIIDFEDIDLSLFEMELGKFEGGSTAPS